MPSCAAVLNFLHKFASPLVVLAEHSKAVSLLYPFTAKGELHFYRGHPALRAVPAHSRAIASLLHAHPQWLDLPVRQFNGAIAGRRLGFLVRRQIR
ncbi:hypothetical protein [Massilia genomosp. 1]|uniref:Uncharacterized protein n=1 Tax=Massilia genomosp. 1 TaxID=2609280 RepID=A0ABX0MZU7_9BURK|nr:hypothetical protein [Massilia genomosp. 1]NHZ65360.1 hypothetical protein [Massilia genomosp. 1]